MPGPCVSHEIFQIEITWRTQKMKQKMILYMKEALLTIPRGANWTNKEEPENCYCYYAKQTIKSQFSSDFLLRSNRKRRHVRVKIQLEVNMQQ